MTELDKKIIKFGIDIDKFSDSHDYIKLLEYMKKIKLFITQNDEARRDARIFYYLGTGYGTYSDYMIRTGKKHTDLEVINCWRCSMYYFRKSWSLYEESDKSQEELGLRILTNYANGLDSAGRVIEALRIYRKVLKMNENFAIARGNYGRALQFLANMVNDSGHYNDIHCYAYQSVNKAISTKDRSLHEKALEVFRNIILNYENMPIKDAVKEAIVYEKCSLGEIEESEYRNWCLENHLFLNPLNEVIEIESAFAHDPLTITTYTESIHHTDSVNGNTAEPPRWFAMLNQLKEEYVYARYLCYEGMKKYKEAHFADRDVKLSLASYDYTNYSIRVEQLKSAFKNLYSILDQICFFVNDFWKLGLEERKADAYNVCKSKAYPKNNIALMSLYWVLCEFYEKYGEAEQASEKELALLRNAIEHKFVKVHEYSWSRKLQLEEDKFYHISEDNLKKYTIRLLEIARESIMYLVYAIGINESKKEKPSAAIPMELLDYDDEWKI
ncbi:MAG: LA2681 family HEPN domain-containing protein [Clostridia bacterium]|nr:LA2681 family HEPN domain-containing protein [Clostridia bacterium]